MKIFSNSKCCMRLPDSFKLGTADMLKTGHMVLQLRWPDSQHLCMITSLLRLLELKSCFSCLEYFLVEL